MEINEMQTERLFNLRQSLSGSYLASFKFPWKALGGIAGMLKELSASLGKEYEEISSGVFIHKTAKVAASAYIAAPCIVGAGSEIRHGAFIRGKALIGEGCVVGNSVEIKNAILFNGVQVPHFNYVGDSILGYKAHMGAGSITSNIKADRSHVFVRCGDKRIPTGLIKLGAMIGDGVEIGCNSVLNPGTVIGRNTTVYPLSSLRGAYPAESIVKSASTVIPKKQQ